jgi:hypothetical protein
VKTSAERDHRTFSCATYCAPPTRLAYWTAAPLGLPHAKCTTFVAHAVRHEI